MTIRSFDLKSAASYAMVIADQALGHVYFHGLDFELGGKFIEIVGQDHKSIAVKVPGHSYWAGNFTPRGYEPTYYQSYSVLGVLNDGSDGMPVMLEVQKTGPEIPARAKVTPYPPMTGYTTEGGAS